MYKRQIAIRVLGRLRRTEEFAAWRRWETHIAAVIVAQQAAAVRTMQETEACKCALRLLGDASLRAVHTRFAFWATNVKMNRLQRRKMRLVLLRMILREQALGMRTWRQEAMKRTEVRRKMRHVLGRMVHSLVSVAWRQWKILCDQVAITKRLISKLLHRMLKRDFTRAWQKWYALNATLAAHAMNAAIAAANTRAN